MMTTGSANGAMTTQSQITTSPITRSNPVSTSEAALNVLSGRHTFGVGVGVAVGVGVTVGVRVGVGVGRCGSRLTVSVE